MTVSNFRLDVISIGGIEVPIGSEDGPTITRQPEVRMGDAIGDQPRPIEVLGDPSVQMTIPVGAITVANRVLGLAAQACRARLDSGAQAATLIAIGAQTRDGYSFAGLGYVMAPTEFSGGTSTPQRSYTVMIPDATFSAGGVAAALAAAGLGPA